jgi:hypothetical protein
MPDNVKYWGQACPICGTPCDLCAIGTSSHRVDANGNCTHGLCSKCPDSIPVDNDYGYFEEKIAKLEAQLTAMRAPVSDEELGIANTAYEAVTEYPYNSIALKAGFEAVLKRRAGG